MVRFGLLATLALLMAVPGSARADLGLTEAEARRLIDEFKAARVQLDAQQKQLDDLREAMVKMQRQDAVLREELARRGVDVDQLLKPPATQSDTAAATLVFESPEAMAEHIRENFSQRIRPDMTQIMREAAKKDFTSWLNSAALLPTQVTWVFRIGDVWKATSPTEVNLTYASDRMPISDKLSKLARTLDEVEMMELNLLRLRTEQKARQERYSLRVKEQAEAPPTHRQLAEQVMKQAYDRFVEINAAVHKAEAGLTLKKRPVRPAKSQPDQGGYRIVMLAYGARDKTIELNIFCHDRDGNLLMSAPKGSLVKVRGWISDIAMGDRLSQLGYRIDHAEVIAVNVETPPPPPALPEAGTAATGLRDSPAPTREDSSPASKPE
jgi:hypothetical protein